MDVSVIIPIYNTKEYIDRCVNSVLRQRGVDYEIILVDDGSTDGSGQLCDGYSEKHECVKVIHKANGGLGNARNSGLDAACGQFIFFLDSDDWIVEGALTKLVYLAKSFQVDIICFQYVQTLTDEYSVMQKEPHGKVMDTRELMRAYCDTEIGPTAWTALYHKKIFDQERFANVALHEDAYSKHLFLEHAASGYVTDEVFYVQYIRKNSLIQSKFTENNMISVKCGERLVKFIKEHYPELTGKAMNIKLQREKHLMDYYILNGKGYRENKRYFWEILETTSVDLQEASFLYDIDCKLYGQMQGMMHHPYLYIIRHHINRIKEIFVYGMSLCYHKLIGK